MKRERQILENQMAIMEALKLAIPFSRGYETTLIYNAMYATRQMLAEPAMKIPQEGDTPQYGEKHPMLDAAGVQDGGVGKISGV